MRILVFMVNESWSVCLPGSAFEAGAVGGILLVVFISLTSQLCPMGQRGFPERAADAPRRAVAETPDLNLPGRVDEHRQGRQTGGHESWPAKVWSLS